MSENKTPVVHQTNKTVPGAPIKDKKTNKRTLDTVKKTLYKTRRVIEIEDDEDVKIVRKPKSSEKNNNNEVIDLEEESVASEDDDETEGSLKDFVVKETNNLLFCTFINHIESCLFDF